MRTAQSMVLVLGSAALLVLSGCSAYGSGGATDPPASSTRVTTSVSPSVPATPSQSQVPTQAPPTQAPPETTVETSPSEPRTPVTNLLDAVPGDQVMVKNEVVTICNIGDGYFVDIFGVNENTSCEFGYALRDKLVEEMNANNSYLRTRLPQTFMATSPVTGQTYAMNCASETKEAIVCRGGNNAAVYFF
ncbi:hypothetical protein ACXZ66_03565 [Corynebacterium sp. S7]